MGELEGKATVNIEDTPEWAAYEKAKTESIKTAAHLTRWTNTKSVQLGDTQGSIIRDYARASIVLDRCIEAVNRKRAELKP